MYCVVGVCVGEGGGFCFVCLVLCAVFLGIFNFYFEDFLFG